MILSFKFSVFDLQIEHKILKEIGEFTLFCMKAISNDMKIRDISNIIQIKEEIIQNQLSFAVSRKYITSDFILTEKGTETVNLFEFINIFNREKLKISLEHYIENDSKQLYSPNNIKFENYSTGYLIKDNFFDYKVQNMFDEMIEINRTKIKDFILKDFQDYKIIIEKHLSDFIFKINKTEKQKFYNYETNDKDFINKLESSKNKINTCIPIDIPMLEVNKDIKSEFLDKAFINNLKSRFENFRYFNLITGEVSLINISNIDEKISNRNLEIMANYTEIDIVKKFSNLEKFLIDELLFIDMKTETKRFYETKFLDIGKIMETI